MPNHESTVGGGWQSFWIFTKFSGRGRKCEKGFCHSEAETRCMLNSFVRTRWYVPWPILTSSAMSWMVRRRTWRMSSLNRAKVSGDCGSSCVFVIVNWYATDLEPGMQLKHLRTTQDLFPEGLLNHCESLRSTFHKIGTKCDGHSFFFFWSIVKISTITYTTPNKRLWKLFTSTQLRATWHTDSLDRLVLPSSGVSR
jgi:hypothetical protein